MEVRKIISRRHYKIGYEVRNELIDGKDCGGEDMEMKSAYTFNGDYIGNPKDAHYLCVKRGILPQKRTSTSGVCSIGYSPKDGKWYGWSHRAIFGFKCGSKCKKTSCHYTKKRGEWIAETMDDAKQMAMDFAEGVS